MVSILTQAFLLLFNDAANEYALNTTIIKCAVLNNIHPIGHLNTY